MRKGEFVMPKISVIIPVYNVERFLKRCLDSVLAQTFQDFEVICVNDGSTDRSGEILACIAEKNSNIKVYSQANKGLSIARNIGLKCSSGDYVCFCDSDDTLHPQCLEIIYHFALKHDADMVQFRQMDYSIENGLDVNPFVKDINYKTLDSFVTDKPLFLGTHHGLHKIEFTATSKLYKRELLEGVEFIPKIHFEDYPHTYAILSKNPRTVVLNTVLYYYTVNPNSIFHQKNSPQQIRDYITGIKYIYNIYKDREEELQFLAKDFIPNILEQQRRRCRKAKGAIKKEMYGVFAEELKYLNGRNLLDIKDFRLYRWVAYRFIMCYY